MISRLIGGFVSILIGVTLVGPLSTQVTLNSSTTNSTGGTCKTPTQTGYVATTDDRCQLYTAANWGSTVLNLVPGFFALGILGIGIAVTYGSLRDAGVV